MTIQRYKTAAAALLLTACARTPDTPSRVETTAVMTSTPNIVKGTKSSPTEDATVLIDVGEDSTCTGTLIAPNLVLTARHCVSEIADDELECSDFTTNFPATGMSIRIGANATPQSTPVARGTKLYVPEQSGTCSYDIALLQLDGDLKSAKVAPVRLTSATKGEGAVTVGYGEDGVTGELTKGRYRRAGLTIDAIGPTKYTFKSKAGQSVPVEPTAGELVTGESTCFGDSGGPLFDAQGAVIGVTSRGVDDECVDRPSIYTGIAINAEFLRTSAIAAGHPLEPESTTQPVDDGEPSEDAISADSASKKKPANTAAPEEEDDADDEDLGPQPHAGCSSSPSSPGSAGWVPLAILLLLLRQRMRARMS